MTVRKARGRRAAPHSGGVALAAGARVFPPVGPFRLQPKPEPGVDCLVLLTVHTSLAVWVFLALLGAGSPPAAIQQCASRLCRPA
jgi:hypothetical protein